MESQPNNNGNIMPHGSKAQGASLNVKAKLATINVIENTSPIGGANEPSANGLWRILALGPSMSSSRSAESLERIHLQLNTTRLRILTMSL